MKSTERNMCHRCGTKIHHLIDFGSNEDGTINTDYCHDCYVGGIFVERGFSLEEKIEKNVPSNEKKEEPKGQGTQIARRIPPKRRRYQEPKAVE